ncbi:MAG: Ig-like domain-containing protein [bacterium]|nr:Ig-like domain-containing protein [bacterium]
MKKEALILLVLVLFLQSVLALSVSLNTPSSGNTTNMTSIIFSCTATEATYTISSISLYMNTPSSSWIQIATQTNASTSANFLISSLSQGTYTWNCFAFNSNNENISASSNNSLTISTLAFSSIIPNQSIKEDANSSALFDLDNYFTGASYYTFSGNTSILLSIDSNNQLSIQPSANFTGSQNITITGKYETSTKTSNEILINITNVNDAPQKIANISSIILEKNVNTTLNMNSYFSDIDPNTNLTYSTSAAHIDIVQNASILILSPDKDWEGTENLTITASDGSASATSNSFTITVGSASTTNTAPIINSHSPDTDPAIEPGDTQDFSLSVSDAESNTLTYTWYVNDIIQTDTDENFSYTAIEEGVFTIKATVSDGTTETTQIWTLTVGNIVISEIDVDSILTESTSSAVCGNKIIESGETCSSCSLDVSCNSKEVCKQGVCEKKKSAAKAIILLAIVSIGIVLISFLIYYFTTLKKGERKQDTTPFQYSPAAAAPPTDYTDFYKRKK